MNGKVERFAQSFKSALRTTMAHVDPRIWEFCIAHIAEVWNLKENNAATKCMQKVNTPGGPSYVSAPEVVREISINPMVGISLGRRY